MSLLNVNLDIPMAVQPGAAIDTSGMDEIKTIQCAAGPSSSIEIQFSNDGGLTWVLVDNFFGSGTVTVSLYAQKMRANVINVDYTQQPSIAISANSIPNALTVHSVVVDPLGESSAIDTSDFSADKTVYCYGGIAAIIDVQMSDDGTNWISLGTIHAGKFLNISVIAQQLKAVTITPDYRDTTYFTVAAAPLVAGGDESGHGGGSGGSGTLTIQDGGTISGTIVSNVYCLGDVTVSGNTFVIGDMYVVGSITNNRGYDFRIDGDLIVDNVFNFTFDPDVNGNAAYIYGDFIFYSGEMRMSKNQEAALYVHGDMRSRNGGFNGSGKANAYGLYVEVGGDYVVPDINLSGGDSDGTANAGGGGYLGVHGDCIINDAFNGDGGYSQGNGYNAGAGGGLEVSGRLIGWLSLQGGNCGGDGHGGGGGYVYCNGDATIYYCRLDGGASYSNLSTHRAGSGGSFNVYGNLTGNGSINAPGGYRSGSLSSNSDNAGRADGGYINVGSNCSIDQVDVSGGQVNCGDNASCPGGNGGTLYVYGALSLHDIYMGGGNSSGLGSNFSAGNAGNLYVYNGPATVTDVYGSGGSSTTSTAGGHDGAGGTIYVQQSITASYISLSDGGGNVGYVPTTASTTLQLSGASVIGFLGLPDRNNARLEPSNTSSAATLKMASYGPKQTLYYNGGDFGHNLGSLASTSIFVFSPGVGWQVFSGEQGPEFINANSSGTLPVVSLATKYSFVTSDGTGSENRVALPIGNYSGQVKIITWWYKAGAEGMYITGTIDGTSIDNSIMRAPPSGTNVVDLYEQQQTVEYVWYSDAWYVVRWNLATIAGNAPAFD